MDYVRHPNTNCLVCNKPIYRRKSQIKQNNNHVFCSMICYGKFIRKEVPCPVCGTLIMAGLNKKTCSRACSNTHRTGIRYKMNRPHDKVVNLRGLKIRLLSIFGKKCRRCSYDKVEILQVHHINRNRSDNELTNLELICPNCHFEEHFLEKSWLKRYNPITN